MLSQTGHRLRETRSSHGFRVPPSLSCPVASLVGVGSAVVESPETPPPLEQEVPSCRQALLDVANTVVKTLSPECFPLSPSRGNHANEVSVLWTFVADVCGTAHVGLEFGAGPFASGAG